MSEQQIITHALCLEKERPNFLPTLVAGNIAFMSSFENSVYHYMKKFTQHYQGGYWELWVFSNGARATIFNDETVVDCENDDNYFDGKMALRSLSLACNLMACSHLSFQAVGVPSTQDVLTRNYHLLRDASFTHDWFKAEAGAIWGLLD